MGLGLSATEKAEGFQGRDTSACECGGDGSWAEIPSVGGIEDETQMQALGEERLAEVGAQWAVELSGLGIRLVQLP